MRDLPAFLTPPQTPRLIDERRWAVREETLDNGLKVRLLEDRALPICAMNTFFGVGSRDESPGQTGVSHFLEHMMFNGTDKVGPRLFDELLERQGGQSNAFTSRDMTAYENDFAASALDCVLRLESDRLSSLALMPTVLRAELDVVLEERRVSLQESIGGRLDEALHALAFRTHPYRVPIIGWQSDLERLDRAACLAHFQTHYAPDNATIWLVGDFESDAVMDKIRALYGPLAASGHRRRVHAPEPAQHGERRTEITFPAHAESLLVGYRAPAARSPQAPIIELIAYLLSASPGARLVRRLVFEERVAVTASADFAWLEDPGLFTIQIDLPPGLSAERALERLDHLLDDIRSNGFGAGELEQAKAEWRAQFLRSLSTCHGRCSLFGINEQQLGDWRESFTMARAIAEATLDEVKAVAQSLFDTGERSVVILRPGERSACQVPTDAPSPRPSAESLPQPLAEDASATETRVSSSAVDSEEATDDFDEAPDDTSCEAPAEFLDSLPPLDTLGRVRLPPFVDRVLNNGLTVSVARHGAVPLFTLCLSLGAGSAHEPGDKSGVADFTMELLRRGSERLSAEAIDDALARLGCVLGVETGAETTSIVASAPAESFVPVLELVAEMVRRPAFDDVEIAAARDRLAARLSLELDEPSIVVCEAMARAAFGEHPYGRTGRGSVKSVQSFTRADVLRMADLILAPQRAILTIVGDLDPACALSTAERVLGDWPLRRDALPHIDAPPPLQDTAILIADMPGAEQAQVILACRGPRKQAPDHLDTTIAAQALGGTFTSRLVQAVRVERGLSYGLTCTLASTSLVGSFSVASFTKNETLRELIDVVLGETARFREEGLNAEELDRLRRSLCGSFPQTLESASYLARSFNDVLRSGFPRDFLEQSVERIRQISASDLATCARRHFFTSGTRIAIAGDAASLTQALAPLATPTILSPDDF